MNKLIPYPAILFLLFGLQFDSVAQYQNILISQFASETTIAIDPQNTNHQVAGANLTNYYYSMDGGQNWSQGSLTSTWGNYGDPNVVCDGAGNFYYFHLADQLDRIICQKSNAFPPSWNSGTYAGQNNPPFLQDHEWAYADWSNHFIYTTWSQYDNYPPQSSADSSHILFSASYDQGATWSPTIRLDERGGDEEYLDVIEPRPATDEQGNVYVSWASSQGLLLDKSTDFGASWRTADQIITPVPGGVYYSIPGINRIRSTPFISIDKSNGPNNGTIYVSWCDQRNGLNNTDVWLIKSTDGGNTWGPEVRVNDDITLSHQFLNAMTVDQVTGNIYVCFYDRRNYTSDTTDFYLAWSNDGGATFTNEKINQQSFVVDASSFFGDYIGIAAHNNVVRPCWSAFDLFGTSYVYTALVDATLLGLSAAEHPLNSNNMSISPSIINSGAVLSFNLIRDANTRVSIYTMEGSLVKTIFDGKAMKGEHTLDQNFQDIPNGVYICEMTTGSQRVTQKFFVMRN